MNRKMSLYVSLLILIGCHGVHHKPIVHSLESDKQAALHGDRAASNRLVDHYIDGPEVDSEAQLKFWSKIAARNGSSSGARMYAIQMDNDGNCSEALKYIALSRELAIKQQQEVIIRKFDDKYNKHTFSDCH